MRRRVVMLIFINFAKDLMEMKILRKPQWLKIKLGGGENYKQVKQLVEENNLHTICSSGKCPNIGECWGKGTATLMILGDICTRSCKFCATKTGKPLPPDPDEPLKIARTVKILHLKHVVLTSVDRDDLPDFGASHWAATIRKCREVNPETVIEVLVPDFQAKNEFLDIVAESGPDIMSHNIETVRRLTLAVRSKADYSGSLQVLKFFSEKGLLTKSGFMLGLGEAHEEILETIHDIFNAGCRILTIGQYLQPTPVHLPVVEYIHPESFEFYKKFALDLGFKQVESAPLVRSSYMAEQSFSKMNEHKNDAVRIEKNVSLKKYHTFGIECFAESFVQITAKSQLMHLFSEIQPQEPVLILGEGSNIVFSSDFNGTILKMDIKGIEKVSSDAETIFVKASAGENWDRVVEYCTSTGWFGLENLSLIPGTVGASPVQNIGAFGVEAGEHIHEVEVFDRITGEFLTLTKEECKFGYRDSRFKHDWKDRYVVTEVIFALSTRPDVNIEYEALGKALAENASITPFNVRDAVISIRRSRLPELEELGNAGSFFKNPVISLDQFQKIQNKYPDIVYYPAENQMVKLAAAWLIDKAGWKGKRHGQAGVHEKQALVIVNYGNAKAVEIIELSSMIQDSVSKTFGVELEPEVIIL